MKFCPNYSAVVTAYDDNNHRLLLRTRCKQWDCEYCAPKNKRTWRYRIMKTIEDSGIENWYFWTLTLSPKYHQTDSTESMLKWQSVWNRLMGKLRYYLGKFMYVRVFETHKSGIFHVHMLASATFDDVVKIKQVKDDQTVNYRHHSAKLEEIMLSYGLGKIHDIKPIITTDKTNNGVARNVSAYVTKYMTKDIQSDVRKLLTDNGLTRVRMIQTSHGWAKETKQTDYDWSVGRITFEDYYNDLQKGVELFDLNNDKIVEGVDFTQDENHSVYPPVDE